MSVNEYLKAQKLGEKKYQAAVAKNENPYLPVLEELVDMSTISGEVNLGLQHIALGQVVGTATSGRTTAFASNFMPIFEYNTEFGAKWSALCDSHLEEGIHDPIKCYEYMNKFYVIEGNKRVSVLKYFEADSVPAVVLRKIPKRTDEPENKIYYEFMDFHKQTGINYVTFTREGGFDKLRELIGIGKTDDFDDDARMDFNSAHLAFEKAFFAKQAGKKLNINSNDAMLVFLNVYGYQSLKDMTGEEVKASVDKVWDEILFINEKKDNVITPMLSPTAPKKKLFGISPMKLTPAKKLKVAFVYDKDPNSSVWLYSHELGRIDVAAKFEDQIETNIFKDVNDNVKLAKCLNQLAEEEYDVIFTTGPQMLPEALKVAVEFPDIKILNCSLNMSTTHVRTYYSRMYEAKFLTGMVAGSLCEDGRIGYIADYPIFGMTANINAFALGAKLVNPRAKIYLEWSKIKGMDPLEKFKEMGISYISSQDMIAPQYASRRFGLFHINDEEIRNLAMPYNNWSAFYERIIENILSGNWKQEEKAEGTKALNYWWGISAGVIDVICSSHLPSGTKRLVNLMKKLISEGSVSPFDGKLVSQDGEIVSEEDTEVSADGIVNMKWLSENVIGSVPELDDLIDEAKQVVVMQGVNTADNLELKMTTDILKTEK